MTPTIELNTKWIGVGEGYMPGRAYWYRKEFSVLSLSNLNKATVFVSGLGYYELYINGSRVGDHVLDPAQTDYTERIFYQTYDITKHIRQGENAAGIWLGDGWYNQNRVWAGKMAYGQPVTICLIQLEYNDGTLDEIVTDASWGVLPSAVILNNVYAGECYDARLEIPDWNKAGANVGKWDNATILKPPGGVLTRQVMEPIRVKETVKPVNISEPQDDIFVFDMGINMVGWVRLKVSGPAGTMVTLRFAEDIDETGMLLFNSCGTSHTHVIQTDIYILKGSGVEVWEPRFTYHGFRYVEVTGYPGTPEQDALEGVVIHTDMAPAGKFTCSDIKINRIHKMVLNTFRSNMLGIPTDCPVRERCGWLGDALIIIEAVLFNWHSRNFWLKYIEDIVTTRKIQGTWRQIAPGKRVSKVASPAWGSAQVVIPWMLYQFYGEKQILKQFYCYMREWTLFLKDSAENDGIIYYGNDDWWPPGNRQDHNLPEGLISTAFYFWCVLIMSEVALILQHQEDHETFVAMAAKIKDDFNNKFFDSVHYSYGTQTANAFALYTKIIPDEFVEKVAAKLAIMLEENNYHLDTGHIGTRYLFEVLSDRGYEYTVWRVIQNEDYPGLYYLVKKGYTTLPERWEGGKSYGKPFRTGSLNHPFKGGFDSWFYTHILGIRIMTPGFKHFMIKPRFYGYMESAKGYYDTVFGRISVSWKCQGSLVHLSLEVPEGSSALVCLPSKWKNNDARQVQCGIVRYNGRESGYYQYTVSPGKYDFTFYLQTADEFNISEIDEVYERV